MRYLISFLICAIGFNSYVHSQCTETTVLVTPPFCDELPLVKVFEANFDGNSLDNSIWCNPYCWGPVNNGQEYNQPQNVEINNGTLKLIAKEETVNYVENGVTYTKNYTSGAIATKKDFGWGVYEMRCKIPYGKGFWPAFWLWSDVGGNNNEIDIFEYYYDDIIGNDNRFYHTVHEGGGSCSGNWYLEDYSSGFHTFKLEWLPWVMKFYVNGVLRFQKYRFRTIAGPVAECVDLNWIDSYYEADQFPDPYKPILANLAIGGGPGGLGSSPDNNTPFPGVFEIDYIRYFQPQQCFDTVIIDNAYIANLNPDIYNVELAEYIIITSTQPIAANQNLHVIASEEVSIVQNFVSASQGEFTFRVDPDICEEYNEVPIITAKTENEITENETTKLPFRFNGLYMDLPIDKDVCNSVPLSFQITNILGQDILQRRITDCNEFSCDFNYTKSQIIFVTILDNENRIVYESKIIDTE